MKKSVLFHEKKPQFFCPPRQQHSSMEKDDWENLIKEISFAAPTSWPNISESLECKVIKKCRKYVYTAALTLPHTPWLIDKLWYTKVNWKDVQNMTNLSPIKWLIPVFRMHTKAILTLLKAKSKETNVSATTRFNGSTPCSICSNIKPLTSLKFDFPCHINPNEKSKHLQENTRNHGICGACVCNMFKTVWNTKHRMPTPEDFKCPKCRIDQSPNLFGEMVAAPMFMFMLGKESQLIDKVLEQDIKESDEYDETYLLSEENREKKRARTGDKESQDSQESHKKDEAYLLSEQQRENREKKRARTGDKESQDSQERIYIKVASSDDESSTDDEY